MATTSTDRRAGVNASAGYKNPVVVAGTGNLTLSGTQTIDGVAVVAEDRVFAANQTDATEIGIYIVASGSWTRAPDWNGAYDVVEGTVIPVSRGTTYAGSKFRVTNTGDITVGTTSITVDRLFQTHFADGSASIPSISFGNDTDTGFYRSADNYIDIAAGGTQVGFFRQTSSGEAEFAIGDDTSDAFPVFKVSERFSRTKVLCRSLLISEAGDGADLAFRHSDGDWDTPTKSPLGWRGADIYWHPWKGDTDAWNVPEPVGDLGADNDGIQAPFYARQAAIWSRTTQTPTLTATGGALVFGTTRNDEVAVRERMWISQKGHVVIGGFGSYEAGNSDGTSPVPTYPDLTTHNYTVDGVQRGRGNAMMGVLGREDSLQTEGFAPLTIIMHHQGFTPHSSISSDQLGPFMSWAAYNDDEAGVDIGYNQTDNEIDFKRVTGARSTATNIKKFMSWELDSGQINLGILDTGAALRVIPDATDNTNGFDIKGQDDGTSPVLEARGANDSNVDIRLVPKGTGLVRFGSFTSSGDVAVNGYVSIKDSGGTTRKLATIA